MYGKPLTQCVGTKKNGERCGFTTTINPDNGLCVWHDPTRADEAKRMRQNAAKSARQRYRRLLMGGAADAPPPPKTLDDIVAYASWLAHATAIGALDARQGQVVASALSAMRIGLEKRDLERQVKELTATVARLKKERGR